MAGLREHWPEAEIEMVVARKFGELVTGPHAVNAVRPIDRPGLAGFYARGGKLDGEWSDYFTEFDLTISYLFDPDEVFAENWRRAGGTGEFLSLDPRNPGEAAWKHLAKPLHELGLGPGDSSRLHGADLVKEKPKQGGEKKVRVTIHPGSGGKKKCWPLTEWVRELDEVDIPVPLEITWLAGEAERDLLLGVPEKWRTGAHRILLERPLPEVFGVLHSSDLYLGHDSGISHLAGWSGTRCGLLFGPSNPAIWAPPGAHVKIWSRGGEWPKKGEWAKWIEGLL
ncbi:MAG: hypothetical protein NTZ01_03430 [Verrucomicrobia bacterium]|nr:hypothetical protein [Verrucomicrobiota bacterium]